MVQFIQNAENDEYMKYKYTASEDNGGLRAIMYHNGKGSTFKVTENGVETTKTILGADTPLKITKADEDKLRLVVCTGDVEIEDGFILKELSWQRELLHLE